MKMSLFRSRALDTASILGGNEFMLSQTFHELHDKMFTSEDLELLKWALGVVWADYEMEYKSQRSFTNLFLPNAKRELARLLSNSMLYGVQNDDTLIWTNNSDRSHRILVVNVKNLPYSICPLAYIGQGPDKKVCEKLALIYSKPALETTSSQANHTVQNQPLSRKMSRTVSYNAEKHLISEINMVAVVPVP